MDELAAQCDGFLGVESVRELGGRGITVSYWRDETAIRAWKRHAEHQLVQQLGREKWYRPKVALGVNVATFPATFASNKLTKMS